ncbi:MAG: 50S ribosomal protein L17 [Patescibacteria group bacterium]
MRHGKTVKTLDRDRASRQALLRGLATSLVLYEKIKTTDAKAKTIKPIIEKHITTAKKGDLAARRQLAKYLYTRGAVKKMIEKIGPRYKDRQGGYLRITKLGPRKGDGAQMVQLELV